MMGFIEKLKLLFRARQPATDLINEIKEVKSGWKTLPFWVTLVGTLLALVAAAEGVLPATTTLIITTVLTAFYNILRGATKANVPGTKPVLQTTEFWLTVLTQISTGLVSLKSGGIDTAWMATASTVVGMAMAAGQNLASHQPNAPTVATPK